MNIGIIKNIRTKATLSFLFLFLLLAQKQALASQPPADFTKSTRYNLKGQITGTILPDPDGAGPLKYAATRNTYNAQGVMSKTESGELQNWKDYTIKPVNWGTDFVVHQEVLFSYDNYGRKLSETTRSGGATYNLKEYKYDNLGQLICKAVRMNAMNSGDACILVNANDRITRFTYDELGYVLKEERAVGTALQQDYVTYTYDNYKNKATVKDANGNVAKMEYDGHNRLKRWYFPTKETVGAGTSNNADYEEYSYDLNGNRLSLRKRDGRVIQYQYDNLSRMTLKDIPGGTSQDVYYGYDLRGLQNYARFGSASSASLGVTNTYDGFGNIQTETTKMGNHSRQLSFAYDANNNRTGLTFPDAQSITMSYDGLDRLASVNKTDGSNLLNQTYHARQGRASTVRSANSTSSKSTTYYNYDAISRPQTITHDLIGGAADVTATFSYNPANQIIGKHLSNDRYHYQGNNNLTGSYQVNGLNQYTSVGGKTITHDANGNMTSDGDTSYTFDIENRLISASKNGINTALTYDPMGRLFSISSQGNTTEFLYDGDRLVAEYSTDNTLLRRYIHGSGIDEPLIWYEGNTMTDANTRFLHADHQGSIIAISDSTGNNKHLNTYDAFGIPQTNIMGRFAYTGQLYLPEINLYHYKARTYHPQLGRFLQTDPVGYEDQINLYAYVGNDPVNMVDPTGKFLNFIIGGLVGAGIEAGIQLATSGKIETNQIIAATAVGAITGGVGGILAKGAAKGAISSGEAIAKTASVGGISNGVATGATNPNATSGEIGTAMVAGAVGAGAGAKIANKTVSKIENMVKSGGLPNHIAKTTQSAGDVASKSSMGGEVGKVASDTISNASGKAASCNINSQSC